VRIRFEIGHIGLINAALTPFVRLTISSKSSSGISSPRPYSLASFAPVVPVRAAGSCPYDVGFRA